MIMTTQATGIVADKKGLIKTIEFLSDRAILQAKGYIERLRQEEMEIEAQEIQQRYRNMTLEEVDAEITALKAKHGTTPNAATIAAMKEAEEGLVERVSLDEIRTRCNAIH